MNEKIIVEGARLHNLKNIHVEIPKGQLVVLTGLSGSGKSTFGFDILLKEGQRQYLEALGLITFGYARPPVDAISGLSPSVSLGQHQWNRSPRSTVGTSSEVYTALRLLFARLGHRPCPRCGMDVPRSSSSAHSTLMSDEAESVGSYPCPNCGTPIPEMVMANFSFNKPAGACPTCTGIGSVHRVDIARLVDERKSLAGGAITGWDAQYNAYYATVLHAAAKHYGLAFNETRPVGEFSLALRDLLLYGVESAEFRRHFPLVEPPATTRQGRFEGAATIIMRRFGEHADDETYRERMSNLVVTQTCPDCEGTRLRPESRAVTVNERNIAWLSSLSIQALGEWLGELPAVFSADENLLAAPILFDLRERIRNLVEVGAGYLALERGAASLSAGEAQRLRLAGLLGSELSGLLYVFDEPTVGIHQRDTRKLIGVLQRLRDLGNTVLVIEHDLEMIAAADYVIDFGPGAGKHGGRVVAMGTPAEIVGQSGSLTADYLAGRAAVPLPHGRRTPGTAAITIRGARQNNLKNISVQIPLGLLVAVTGVSGSGKSSLVFDILDPALRQKLNGASREAPGAHDAIEGWESLGRVITISQEPLARMPRSNAATYTEIFTPVREVFATTEAARSMGITARHFSFNTPGGRCERCEGSGILAVSMHFLPDVEIRCPVCQGRRYTGETLAVHYRGHDIAEVLEMTIEDALKLFEDVPAVRGKLAALDAVGLGYLPLGQPATTLSGGEAQRVKLAKELGRRTSGQTLYLLDEPTTGLHLADTVRLLDMLQKLVDTGNSVIVVEHNLELVKAADWVIDLGPEGGNAGGEIISQGTPEQVAREPRSHTGAYLRELLGASFSNAG